MNPKVKNKIIFSKKYSTIIPVASSNFDFKQICYIKQYSDSIPNPKKKELQADYLLSNINRLIPIQVNEHIIWFEPTEALLAIVNPNRNVKNNNNLNLMD